MGKWLRKIQQARTEDVTTETSVSSVSAPDSVFGEKNNERNHSNVKLPVEVTSLLYRAADLVPELPLILGPNNDEGFIDRILAGKTRRERHLLLTRYQEIWRAAAENSSAPEYALDNIGRRHANRWLREEANTQRR